MEIVNKIRDLLPGKYLVSSYEPIKSSYGTTHIITATHESNEQFRFFSNTFLSDYITLKKPQKKFEIECRNGKLTITGYSRVINLN